MSSPGGRPIQSWGRGAVPWVAINYRVFTLLSWLAPAAWTPVGPLGKHRYKYFVPDLACIYALDKQPPRAASALLSH